MKDDEKRFLIDVYKLSLDRVPHVTFGGLCVDAQRRSPRDLINQPDFYMHYKRAWYLLEKWGNKDWYDWDVTMDLGWITPKGVVKAKKLMGVQ